MNLSKLIKTTSFSKPSRSIPKSKTSLYDIEINRLNGQPLSLGEFKGKYILFVNVASKCGFTSQYKDLQNLYEQFKNILVIVGIPCNQFGNQEPGNASDISTFCETNYGIRFPMTQKIDVTGSQQHPLYQWLTQKKLNGVKNSTVKWNFQKYLVNPEGILIDYYYSITLPTSSKIIKHLK